MPKPIARLIILFILFNIVLVVWMVFASLPLWTIKDVAVENFGYVPKVVLMDKIKPLTNGSLLRLDTAAVTKELLKLPWVTSVTYERKFSHTLLVKPIIRQPLFALQSTDRHTWVIDKTGALLNRDGVEVTGVPVYTVHGINSIAEIDDFLKNCLPLITELQGLFAPDTVIVDYTYKNNIRVLTNGFIIKVGDPLYYQEKGSVLRELLKNLSERLGSVEYIDIRAYKTPAVKFR